MSGNIVIDGNAQVEVSSNDQGAGIGSGDDGNLSGNIMIGGNAQVSATGAEDSAGIGTGDDGHSEAVSPLMETQRLLPKQAEITVVLTAPVSVLEMMGILPGQLP